MGGKGGKVQVPFQGCDKQDHWPPRPKVTQQTVMSAQEANHNPCCPFSLREGTRSCFEVRQKGERCNPKRDGHHYQLRCRTYILCPPFWPYSAKNRSKLRQKEFPSTSFGLVPSGDKRQVVDESRRHRNKVHPETLTTEMPNSTSVAQNLRKSQFPEQTLQRDEWAHAQGTQWMLSPTA